MNAGGVEPSNALARVILATACDLADTAASVADPRRRANAYRDAIALARKAIHYFDYPHDGDDDAVIAWLDHDRRRTNVAASATLLTQQRDELLAELFALETENAASPVRLVNEGVSLRRTA